MQLLISGLLLCFLLDVIAAVLLLSLIHPPAQWRDGIIWDVNFTTNLADLPIVSLVRIAIITASAVLGIRIGTPPLPSRQPPPSHACAFVPLEEERAMCVDKT